MVADDDYATTRIYRARARDVYQVLMAMLQNNKYFTLMDSDASGMRAQCRANSGGALYSITIRQRDGNRCSAHIIHVVGTGMASDEQVSADIESLFSGLLALLRRLNVIEMARNVDIRKPDDERNRENGRSSGGTRSGREAPRPVPPATASRPAALQPVATPEETGRKDTEESIPDPFIPDPLPLEPRGKKSTRRNHTSPDVFASFRANLTSTDDVAGGDGQPASLLNTACRAVGGALHVTPRTALLLCMETLIVIAYLIVALATHRMPVWLTVLWPLVALCGALPCLDAAFHCPTDESDDADRSAGARFRRAAGVPGFIVAGVLLILVVVAFVFSLF